jgi:ATP-dependent Clp protease ATP-binding subunit ClpA
VNTDHVQKPFFRIDGTGPSGGSPVWDEYVGTEHILFAMLRLNEEGACDILNFHGITYLAVIEDLQNQLHRGFEKKHRGIHPPMFLTPYAQRSLEQAVQESRSLHVLLALLHEEDTVAFEVLKRMGLTWEQAIEEVVVLNPQGLPEGQDNSKGW